MPTNRLEPKARANKSGLGRRSRLGDLRLPIDFQLVAVRIGAAKEDEILLAGEGPADGDAGLLKPVVKDFDLGGALEPEAQMEPGRRRHCFGGGRERKVHAGLVAHEQDFAVADRPAQPKTAFVEGRGPLDRGDLQVQVVDVHRPSRLPLTWSPRRGEFRPPGWSAIDGGMLSRPLPESTTPDPLEAEDRPCASKYPGRSCRPWASIFPRARRSTARPQPWPG